jgi:hypothetical protein
LAALALPAVPRATAQDAEEIRRLVDEIARGDEQDAADAADELVDRLIGPVAAALGSLEARPAAEQLRIRKALARLSAVLRVRLTRADLPAEDRELFDTFAKRYPELVERLFADDWRRRLSALRQIPLEPRTGAGVLIAVKVNDPDEDVAVAALEIAAKLGKSKDEGLVRGLARYVRGATATLKSGLYGPEDQDLAATVALFVSRAIKVLCAAEARASVPAIADALDTLGHSDYRVIFDTAGIALGLGELRDERAADVLLKFVHDRQVHQNKALPGRRLLRQTIGDAALLGLLRIYGLEPKVFGFVEAEGVPFLGFLDAEAREAAQRRFLRWHKENAGRPPGERTVPTSQPTEKDGG